MEDIDYEACNNTGLGLGLRLGLGGYYSGGRGRDAPAASLVGLELDLSFSLRHKDEDSRSEHEHEHEHEHNQQQQQDQQLTTNKRTHHQYHNNFNIDSSRKKLRLTKQQSTLLEESFKLQTTLNPVQKKTLAEQLNLKPRQVEVWFQNRRARTKLKQTEVDCEFLKKCCEKLRDENTRLKKEVEELKTAPPFYIQLPKAETLSMCPSCHKRGRSEEQ